MRLRRGCQGITYSVLNKARAGTSALSARLKSCPFTRRSDVETDGRFSKACKGGLICLNLHVDAAYIFSLGIGLWAAWIRLASLRQPRS